MFEQRNITAQNLPYSGVSYPPHEAWLIASLIAEVGVEPSSALKDPKLQIDALAVPNTRVQLYQLAALHRLARSVGICWKHERAAAKLKLSSFGMAGFLLLTSPTLRVAVSNMNRFSNLLNLRTVIDIRQSGNKVIVHGEVIKDIESQVGCDMYELDILKTRNFISEIGKGLIRSHDGSLYVHHDCRFAYEFFTESGDSRSVLDTRFSGFSDVSYNICMGICEDQVNNKDIDDFLSIIINDIQGLDLYVPTLSDLSRKIGISERTLRRKLKDVGTSFSDLLDSFRKTKAETYLLNTDMTNEEIATKLGYSEAANFRHAFKRWTGTSPREYKRRFSS